MHFCEKERRAVESIPSEVTEDIWQANKQIALFVKCWDGAGVEQSKKFTSHEFHTHTYT